MNIRTSRDGGTKILLAFATMLGVVVGALALTAMPASAHDATITAQADCAGTVSYTVTSWMGTTPESRTNADVDVDASTDGGATWSTVGSGAFSAPDFSFTGTWPAGTPLPTSLQLRAHTVATWGDGVAGGQYTAPYPVTLPTGCQPASQPKASIDHTCTGYDATLDNTASTAAVTYDVAINGTTTEVTVPAGVVEHHTGSLPPGRTSTITVSAGGTVLATATQSVCTVPSAKPAATLTGDCSGITATLTNTAGTAAAVFTLTSHSPAAGAGTVRHYTVPAGKTLTLPKLRRHGGHTERVVLTATGMATMSRTVGARCGHPHHGPGSTTGPGTTSQTSAVATGTTTPGLTQAVPTAVDAGESMMAASPVAAPRTGHPSPAWLLAITVLPLLATLGLLAGSGRRRRN